MSSVLYDHPGPRARRRILVGSVVAAIGVAALVVLAAGRLADQGQFAADRWAPLFYPGDPRFPLVWARIGEGFRATVVAAALAMAFSLVLGMLLAAGRIMLGKAARIPLVAAIELFRGLPVVISIFFAYKVLPELGLELNALGYLVIGLTAYNSVIIAETLRAGVASLPRGQHEAALALGMSEFQSLRYVRFPQAIRIMLPALVSQLVVILKDTSLVVFIGGYVELLRTGGLLVQNLGNPIQVYILIGAIYVAVNYALGRFATYVERRLSRAATVARAPRQVATLASV
ncbi:MAG TPA: amino acid ABC transporter permease [Longimicrobiales bacterium]|nr:amino acid ABC transporter permease [Longimicrobiales bacterium]